MFVGIHLFESGQGRNRAAKSCLTSAMCTFGSNRHLDIDHSTAILVDGSNLHGERPSKKVKRVRGSKLVDTCRGREVASRHDAFDDEKDVQFKNGAAANVGVALAGSKSNEAAGSVCKKKMILLDSSDLCRRPVLCRAGYFVEKNVFEQTEAVDWQVKISLTLLTLSPIRYGRIHISNHGYNVNIHRAVACVVAGGRLLEDDTHKEKRPHCSTSFPITSSQ